MSPSAVICPSGQPVASAQSAMPFAPDPTTSNAAAPADRPAAAEHSSLKA